MKSHWKGYIFTQKTLNCANSMSCGDLNSEQYPIQPALCSDTLFSSSAPADLTLWRTCSGASAHKAQIHIDPDTSSEIPLEAAKKSRLLSVPTRENAVSRSSVKTTLTYVQKLEAEVRYLNNKNHQFCYSLLKEVFRKDLLHLEHKELMDRMRIDSEEASERWIYYSTYQRTKFSARGLTSSIEPRRTSASDGMNRRTRQVEDKTSQTDILPTQPPVFACGIEETIQSVKASVGSSNSPSAMKDNAHTEESHQMRTVPVVGPRSTCSVSTWVNRELCDAATSPVVQPSVPAVEVSTNTESVKYVEKGTNPNASHTQNISRETQWPLEDEALSGLGNEAILSQRESENASTIEKLSFPFVSSIRWSESAVDSMLSLEERKVFHWIEACKVLPLQSCSPLLLDLTCVLPPQVNRSTSPIHHAIEEDDVHLKKGNKIDKYTKEVPPLKPHKNGSRKMSPNEKRNLYALCAAPFIPPKLNHHAPARCPKKFPSLATLLIQLQQLRVKKAVFSPPNSAQNSASQTKIRETPQRARPLAASQSPPVRTRDDEKDDYSLHTPSSSLTAADPSPPRLFKGEIHPTSTDATPVGYPSNRNPTEGSTARPSIDPVVVVKPFSPTSSSFSSAVPSAISSQSKFAVKNNKPDAMDVLQKEEVEILPGQNVSLVESSKVKGDTESRLLEPFLNREKKNLLPKPSAADAATRLSATPPGDADGSNAITGSTNIQKPYMLEDCDTSSTASHSLAAKKLQADVGNGCDDSTDVSLTVSPEKSVAGSRLSSKKGFKNSADVVLTSQSISLTSSVVSRSGIRLSRYSPVSTIVKVEPTVNDKPPAPGKRRSSFDDD